MINRPKIVTNSSNEKVETKKKTIKITKPLSGQVKNLNINSPVKLKKEEPEKKKKLIKAKKPLIKKPESPTKIRKFLNDYTPPRHCDNCVLSSKCPLYVPSKICGFTSLIDSKSVDGAKDVSELQLKLIEVMGQRIQFAVIAEQLSGDVSDETLNKMITTLSFLIKDYNSDKKQVGTFTAVPQLVSGNDQEKPQGIVQFLFGNMMQQVGTIPERPKVTNVPSMEVSDLDEVKVNYLENKKSDAITKYLNGKNDD